MKWFRLMLNREFRAAVIGLVDTVQDATEDGKLSAAEQAAVMKSMWAVVRVLRKG